MKITVLLATYNGERYIDSLLNSLMKQTISDFSILISDDFSSDKTLDIIKKHTHDKPGKIRLLSHPTRFGNAKDNFLFLLKNATGDVFLFCDQDDIWLPNKIERTLNEYSRHEINKTTPTLIHTDLKVVDQDLKIIHSSFIKYSRLPEFIKFPQGYLFQNNVTGCTTLINEALRQEITSVLKKYPSLHTKIIMHDWFLAIVASFLGRIYFIPEQLILYRQHAANSVGAKNTGSVYFLISKLLNMREYIGQNKQAREQANAFFAAFKGKLNPGFLPFVRSFCSITEQNKVSRITFHIKNHLLKHGLLRKAAQIFWI